MPVLQDVHGLRTSNNSLKHFVGEGSKSEGSGCDSDTGDFVIDLEASDLVSLFDDKARSPLYPGLHKNVDIGVLGEVDAPKDT